MAALLFLFKLFIVLPLEINVSLFKVKCIEKAGLECKVITKFFGSTYFIRKDSIEKVVDSCEVVRLK